MRSILVERLPVMLALILLTGVFAVSANAQDGTSAGTVALPAKVLDPAIDAAELGLRVVPLTREELAALASKWLDIVKEKTHAVVEAKIAVSRSTGADLDTARDNLARLTGERNAEFDKLRIVVGNWEKKGGDPAAIEEYRTYYSAVTVEEARTSDVHTLAKRAIAWVTARDGGLDLLKSTVVVVVALLVLLFVARMVRRWARRWIEHVPNLSKLLQSFVVKTIYWVVLAVGLMVVLSALGVDITPLFALIGGASFILAFAFQETLGNLASGLMIMANRPFDEGEFVDVGGVAGTVKSVSIVATTVTTPDNQVIVIPNKQVWGNVITNVTTSPTRRIDLVFGISYEDSIADALSVMEETVKSHPLVLSDPQPVIKVHALADSSVNFICRPWVKGSDYWTVYWDLTRQMKERFDAAGISIPYPQRDVHLKGALPQIEA